MVAFLNADQKLLNMYFSEEGGADLATNQQKIFNEGIQAIQSGFKGVIVSKEQPIEAMDEQFSNYKTPVLKSWVNDKYAKGSYSNFGIKLAEKLA